MLTDLVTGTHEQGRLMAFDSEYETDWKNKHKGVAPCGPKLVE